MPEFLYPSLVSYVADVLGIDSAATSFTLTDTDMFPDVGDYRILVDREIMVVSSHLLGVLTVTRGAEDTTATAHATNAQVFTIWTAGGMNAWKAS